MRPLMKCGCVAQGVDACGGPICAVHAGFTPDARIIDENPPDLTGRKAKCTYCKNVRDSALTLPFFEHRPTDERDGYYCGCYGWE